jgi:putative ABC transport system permease protein
MRTSDAVRFAFHSLTAQPLRTFLSALGIAIGITAVILLTSIGQGLHTFVIDEFTQFGTNLIGITPGHTDTRGGPVGAINTVRPLSIDDALALRRAPPYPGQRSDGSGQR